MLRRKQAPPWQQFRVKDSIGKIRTHAWSPLIEVFRVAHLEAAHRIVIDGRIRSGLIFDESKLNQERVLVSWLSPNYWYHGFRYGSVRFTFDWQQLIEGHQAYWVESIAYGVTACRIFLTKNDYDDHHLLIPYDPTVGDGPWWHNESTDTHHWNGEHCLEFMFEHDLELGDLADLDFVRHHRNFCNTAYGTVLSAI